MPSFNEIFLMGNLTRDPQQNNQMVVFGLAVNRKWTDQQGQTKETTLFINCVCFGKLAQTAAQYLSKGSRVFVAGELDLNRWTDQQGQKRETYQVKVQRLQFLDPPPRQNQGWGGQRQPPQAPPQAPPQQNQQWGPPQGDNDLPF